ncbi:MAG: class II fructose-bisphosphate aldolase [Clostridiales bacterium]|jgi:tagatose 1,6-diphosphate aldolase GatY/KbaY|nr:class II fructose-bisphosphate aldolase [Clostridiales bacterium]
MLYSLKTMINDARDRSYCVPAFNVYNIETVMGIIAAAEEEKSPVILQLYPRLINEDIGLYLAPVILKAAETANVPVCFHLDHGPSESEVIKALRYGATGIMIDGSTHDFEGNVALTKRVVDTCAAVGVAVEGELGHVGSANDERMGDFTDPDEAGEFVERTGVCAFAVLIGNAHGHYKKTPCLDIERVKEIRKRTGDVPLVLHGGTGIPDEQVRSAIAAGVCKMNIGTDVCVHFASGTLETLSDKNRHIAVDVFMKKPIERVKELGKRKIALVGSAGKA